MGINRTVTASSSFLMRLCAVAFMRFIPSHLGSIVFALFAVYLTSFTGTLLSGPPLEVIDDEVDITVKETTATPAEDNNGSATEAEPEVIAEEIDVEETVILAEKPTLMTDILLYGIPSMRRPFLSLVTLLINVGLVALTADAMFRHRWYHKVEDLSFVRLGYVSHHEATFVIREPDQSKMPVSLEMRPKEAGTLTGVNIWLPGGGITYTTNETDFTRSITVPFSTSVQRRYEWRTSNGFTGEVLSAPRTGHLPEVETDKFTFLSTSCILTRFPYSPLEHPLSIPGLRHLARKLPELNAQFMMFLGDFIYVDVPERFGSSKEEYRMQYRQVYASPDWPAVSNISWIHAFDDHEISNDWSSKNTGVYNASMDPWHIYQGDANPPTSPVPGIWNKHREGATWFEFVQGPASFFMMDTRSYRSSNNVPYLDEDKTMLGEEQLADLLAWLARPEPRGVKWKVVGSSIPFTKNWPVNRKDTWGGFLVERKKILEAMWDSGARGMSVIILSGDRHEFAATKFPPPADSEWPLTAAAYEFSTSPLNQFASPIKSYRQTDDEDVKLGYIPGGMSKFGAFTIENVAGESTMQYRLFINGEERWSTMIAQPPAVTSGSIGGAAGGKSSKSTSFLSRLGLI